MASFQLVQNHFCSNQLRETIGFMFISNSYFLVNSAVIYFDFLGEYEVFAKFYFFSSISRIIEVFMNIYNDKIFDHNLCALLQIRIHI